MSKNQTWEPESWVPVRRGEIYCAPACGRGCTWDEYREALKISERIAKQLPGFKPRVMENLGWHASAEALDGHIQVSYSRGTYFAFASCDMKYAGNAGWGISQAKTAQKAFALVLKKLRAHVAKETAFLEKLEKLKEEGGSK
jgi:hypothetical protein